MFPTLRAHSSALPHARTLIAALILSPALFVAAPACADTYVLGGGGGGGGGGAAPTWSGTGGAASGGGGAGGYVGDRNPGGSGGRGGNGGSGGGGGGGGGGNSGDDGDSSGNDTANGGAAIYNESTAVRTLSVGAWASPGGNGGTAGKGVILFLQPGVAGANGQGSAGGAGGAGGSATSAFNGAGGGGGGGIASFGTADSGTWTDDIVVVRGGDGGDVGNRDTGNTNGGGGGGGGGASYTIANLTVNTSLTVASGVNGNAPTDAETTPGAGGDASLTVSGILNASGSIDLTKNGGALNINIGTLAVTSGATTGLTLTDTTLNDVSISGLSFAGGSTLNVSASGIGAMTFGGNLSVTGANNKLTGATFDAAGGTITFTLDSTTSYGSTMLDGLVDVTGASYTVVDTDLLDMTQDGEIVLIANCIGTPNHPVPPTVTEGTISYEMQGSNLVLRFELTAPPQPMPGDDPSATAIPTLSQWWAIVLLGGLLTGTALMMLRRHSN